MRVIADLEFFRATCSDECWNSVVRLDSSGVVDGRWWERQDQPFDRMKDITDLLEADGLSNVPGASRRYTLWLKRA